MDTAGPGGDQGSGPGSAAPPSGWKQRRWEAGRWAEEGAGRRAAVVGEGKPRLILCKLNTERPD